jgi:hypothetical protein
MAATDRQSINEYFDLLEDTLTKNGIADKPANIFNCDETGMQLDHRAPRVVVPLTQKHPYTVTSGCKTQITVLACISAAGYAIPPFVIYDRKSLNVEWTANEVPGTAYGLSERGWIDSELFMGWFYHHFLMHAPKARPLLLLIDGHASHYNPAVIEKATEESIILFGLPPNTTHLVQLLDRCCFSTLKKEWNESCHDFMSERPGEVVNRANFNTVFQKAWVNSMTMKNITASFRLSGVQPVNRYAVVLPQEEKVTLPAKPTLFVPLVTPRRLNPGKTNVDKMPLTGSSPSMQSIEFSKLEVEFTDKEERRFARRYEEGYDIAPDSRYSEWLKRKEAADKLEIIGKELPLNNRVLSPVNSKDQSRRKYLPFTLPVLENPSTRGRKDEKSKEKVTGRVLTTQERLQELKAKKAKKDEELKRKEMRKAERDERRIAKLAMTVGKQKLKGTSLFFDRIPVDRF